MTPGPHALGNLPARSGSSGDVREILGGERPFVDSFIYLDDLLSASYGPDNVLAGCCAACMRVCTRVEPNPSLVSYDFCIWSPSLSEAGLRTRILVKWFVWQLP